MIPRSCGNQDVPNDGKSLPRGTKGRRKEQFHNLFFFRQQIHFFANFVAFSPSGVSFSPSGVSFSPTFDHEHVLYSEPSSLDRSISRLYQRTSTSPPSNRPARPPPTHTQRKPAQPAQTSPRPNPPPSQPPHSQDGPAPPAMVPRLQRDPLLEIRPAKARTRPSRTAGDLQT